MMIIDLRLTVRFLISGLLLLLVFFHNTFADDPGITKVRLIQQTDTSYLFEADVPQLILSSIKKPVLPERFNYSDFELTNQSGWITLRTIISTSDRPFDKDDEILLPWLRNGVDFTAQWKDGSTFKGLFTRSLKGIHIPLAEVMETRKSTTEVLSEATLMALRHFTFEWIHVLFIMTLVWVLGSLKKIFMLFWWSLGHGLSMILGELGVPGFDLLFSETLLLLFTLLVAYGIAYEKEFKFFWVALIISGTLHGLSYLNDIEPFGFSGIQKVQALFAFSFVTDILHFGLAWIFFLLIPYIKKNVQSKKMAILIGGISISLMLSVFTEYISSGNIRILTDHKASSKNIRLPSPANLPLKQVQRGTGLMTSPIMAYLSIEPYEVRQEVLLKAEPLLEALFPDFRSELIPIDLQEQLKLMLLDSLNSSTNNILLDQQLIQSVEKRANFVSLSRGGVTVRETPIEEKVKEGIMGITMIYDIPTFPKTIEYHWNFFPGPVSEIEASIVDPYGVMTAILSDKDQKMNWENRLSGFDLPTVDPIQIVYYPLPLVTMSLWLVLLLFSIFSLVKMRKIRYKTVLLSLIALGFVLYPFLRTETSIPFLPKWKPSKERSGIILNDLLTNVYRSFDRRNEEDVYDRLAMSVTGEQLTEIYLSNRQAMALENRGGARANVDEVNMLEIHDIEYAEEHGFTADAAWTVRGSVNHFGHTHYRQNRYRAFITFIDKNDVWKINSIETIEEERVY